MKQWTIAVGSGHIEAILALYAPDAILVPTLSNEVVVTEEGRRRYFEFFLSNGVSECLVDGEVIRINHELRTVAIGGIYTFYLRNGSGEQTVEARFLFTLEEIGGRWLITGHHSSRCV
ncbi:nuclear transport factor 2 family protein [Roseibium sp. RKSG952]|uniref:nuclear transport factor 2 family protein n=1 Tax=Roseibium sp. RKSG952 TaxID=2529384 RepID=UPI001AD8C121|nr:nuclear transport factor 2 family protein [Roseibium sp. RKSG952]